MLKNIALFRKDKNLFFYINQILKDKLYERNHFRRSNVYVSKLRGR